MPQFPQKVSHRARAHMSSVVCFARKKKHMVLIIQALRVRFPYIAFQNAQTLKTALNPKVVHHILIHPNEEMFTETGTILHLLS